MHLKSLPDSAQQTIAQEVRNFEREGISSLRDALITASSSAATLCQVCKGSRAAGDNHCLARLHRSDMTRRRCRQACSNDCIHASLKCPYAQTSGPLRRWSAAPSLAGSSAAREHVAIIGSHAVPGLNTALAQLALTCTERYTTASVDSASENQKDHKHYRRMQVGSLSLSTLPWWLGAMCTIDCEIISSVLPDAHHTTHGCACKGRFPV